MSEDSLPLEQWPAGIQQASVPANENALRVQALLSRALSVENDAPGTEYNGAVYIVGDTPAGAFSSFAEHDIALYEYDSWYAWSPVLGSSMVVANVRKVFNGAAWIDDPSVGGGGGGGVAPVVTVSGTSLTADDTNAGNYTRFTSASAKTYTFDDAETYAVGAEYHGRNVGAGDLTITEAGTFTVNPPAGGTLVIPQGGTFTVKIVAADEADLFGVTVEESS